MYYLSLLNIFREGIKFQPSRCNCCHDVLTISIDLSSAAILNTHDVA